MLGMALAALASAAIAVSATADLPLRGTTERGQEWRLRAAKQMRAGSWCLDLGYTTGVVLDGDRYAGGLRTCGRRPARRVSGVIAVDCERGGVFVFGGARRGISRLRLRNDRGLRRVPRFASVPPAAGFRGRIFIAVAGVRDLPLRLTARGDGQRTIARVAGRSRVCRPHPGAPNGGEPFMDFETRR